MVGSDAIRVDEDGLHAMAAACFAESAGLSAKSPTSISPVLTQASSAAVSDTDAAVSADGVIEV